jgi:hypothetical protein
VPSFTIEAADLETEGPVIDTTVAMSGPAHSALVQGGQQPPAPVSASLLVDTGASHSMVRDGLLSTLQLHPVGTVGVNTPTSQGVQCGLYSVRITLPHGQFVDTTVIQSPPSGFQGQNIDGVIGRDVLKWGILIYMGQRAQFTLSF